MKTIAIIAAVGVAAALLFSMSPGASNQTETQFRDFMDVHRVGYGTAEEFSYRLGVFQDNLKRIEELNQANPRATFAVNQFADRTPAEMEKMMGLIVPVEKQNQVIRHTKPVNGQSVDWTDMWSAVKNQGSCGSCWAFSATAAFEARYSMAHGGKIADTLYAEQELVDCDPKSSGCNGGFMDYAFEYLMSHGFCTESAYPYHARDETCKDSECTSGPSDKSFTDVNAGDEDGMLKELLNGPIAVAVDAGTWSFYSGGVLSSCGKNLNHGVTLVQTDFEASTPFAKIRNSWGSGWGEKGFIRLEIGNDVCGYADVSSYPTF